MSGFKHIVVPVDFGDASDRALDVALDLAAKFEAKVTLLHATWLPPFYYGVSAEGLAWPVDELETLAKKQLDAAVAAAKARYPKVEGVMTAREPRESILRVAKEHDADLIVMGTHGRRGLTRVLLGSVAETVVRTSPIPVLTVSAPA